MFLDKNNTRKNSFCFIFCSIFVLYFNRLEISRQSFLNRPDNLQKRQITVFQLFPFFYENNENNETKSKSKSNHLFDDTENISSVGCVRTYIYESHFLSSIEQYLE